MHDSKIQNKDDQSGRSNRLNQSTPMFKVLESQMKLVFIAIVVAVLIAVGGILFLKTAYAPTAQAPSNEQPTINNQPFDSAQGEQPVLDTSNWQTYTNTQYGFEVQYPLNFTQKEESYSSPPSLALFRDEIGTLFSLYAGRDIQSFVLGQVQETQRFQKEFNGKTWVIVIGEIPVDVLSLSMSASVMVAYTSRGDIVYLLECLNCVKLGSTSETESSKIFDQILSTFRFVDGSPDTTVIVPRSYTDCLGYDSNYTSSNLKTPNLDCSFEVIDFEGNVSNKVRFDECEKIGGVIYTDQPNAKRCWLGFYSPDYTFSTTFEECRDALPQETRQYIDANGWCGITIYGAGYSTTDPIMTKALLKECAVRGGQYSDQLTPTFSSVACGLKVYKE